MGIFLGEFFLEGPDFVESQGVLHGHCDLVGDEFQEASVGRVVTGQFLARENERAEAPSGSRQRELAGALKPDGYRELDQPRPVLELGKVRDDVRLLGFPNPARR